MTLKENHLYVVMGVSGCGKSTIGSMLSEELQIPFYDGDDFHPDANLQKMASGSPLNDEDRWPWLQNINSFAAEKLEKSSLVIACSALKEKYRTLIADKIETQFIYLQGSKELIAGRLQKRTDHFMPMDLLDSQFEALEEPREALSVRIDQNIEQIVEEILDRIE